MATAVATDPYSSSRIHPGTRQSWPSVCAYQTKKTRRTLTVQIMSGKEAAEFVGRTNGQVMAGGSEVLRQYQLDEIKRWTKAAEIAGIPKE